jgi:hypothetical protein
MCCVFVLSEMEFLTTESQDVKLRISNLVYKTSILNDKQISLEMVERLYAPIHIKYYKGHFRAICVRGEAQAKGSLIIHFNGKLQTSYI